MAGEPKRGDGRVAVIYVSSRHESADDGSVAAKVAAMKRQLSGMPQLTLVGVFIDRGVSGLAGLGERPMLRKALQELDARPGSTLVVDAISALGRSQDTVAEVARELVKADARLSVCGWQGSVSAEQLWPVLTLLGENTEAMRERIVRGLAIRAQARPASVPGSLPFGFRRVGSAIEVDQSQWTVVERVYELAGAMATEGAVNYGAIAARIDKEGLARLSVNRIRRILTNSIYVTGSRTAMIGGEEVRLPTIALPRPILRSLYDRIRQALGERLRRVV